MAFDPDEYLASKSGGFDPDAYLDGDQPARKPKFENIEQPSWIEQQIAKLPSIPQEVVNLAAGASEMGGMLRDAPRLKNVATEDGWRTAGRIFDPVAAAVGVKGFQAAQQLPKLGAALEAASPLMSRIRPVLDKITGAAIATPFRQSVVGGAGAGAAVGALQGEPLEGAAMGAAMGAAFRPLEVLGTKAFQLAQDIKYGAEGEVVNYLNQVFKGDKDAVLSAIQQLKAIVPGERPTTGLAATIDPERALALKALEEQARTRNPQMFIGADRASVAARSNPLDELAFQGQRYYDPEIGKQALSVAEARRKAITAPIYEKANPQQVEIPPELAAKLFGPQASPLTASAERGIQQATGSPVNIGSGYSPKGPDVLGMIPEGTPFMPSSPTMTIGDLQSIKNELSKKIASLASATDAPSITARGNLIAARDDLLKQMTSQSSDYALANTMFKNLSELQNQADVSKVLLDALRSPAGKERYDAFLSAMQNAPKTIKASGGDPRFKDLREIYTPEQMGTARAIESSVKREADYAALPATQAMLPELKGAWAGVEEVTPALLKSFVTILRRALVTKEKSTTMKAKEILDEASSDPQKMMDLLNATLPKDRNEIANMLVAHQKKLRGAATGVVVGSQ